MLEKSFPKDVLICYLCCWIDCIDAVQYAVFGKVTKGDETLRKLEGLPTRKEGIFVMVCI